MPPNIFPYWVPSSVLNALHALGHMSSKWSYEIKAIIISIFERTLKLGKDKEHLRKATKIPTIPSAFITLWYDAS